MHPFVLPLLSFAAALLGGPVFVWWWPAVPALWLGFWKPERIWTGLAGVSLGSGAAWGAVALWFEVRNHGLLSGRIAALFHLPGGAALLLAAAGIGAVTAGLGFLFGARFRRFWAGMHQALAAQDVVVPPDEEARVEEEGRG